MAPVANQFDLEETSWMSNIRKKLMQGVVINSNSELRTLRRSRETGTSPVSSHNIPAITGANNAVTPNRRHRVPVQNNDSNQPHYNGQLSGSTKILPVWAFLRHRI